MNVEHKLQLEYEDELKHVPVSKICINPQQPRKEFNEEDLEELAQSIRTVGILHPPLVRSLPNSENYELISGERRLRAAQRASLSTIPVYVRKSDDFISAHASLIENVQRVDLNPLEIAKALKCLMDKFGYTQEQLAEKIGKKRSTTANYLRLLTLPSSIQNKVAKGTISMGHAKAILSLNNEMQQNVLLEKIIKNNLSVRQAEHEVTQLENLTKKQKLKKKMQDVFLEDLITQLRERFGTRVAIQAKGKRGTIIIDYYDYDDLDRILSLMNICSHESL